VINSSIIFSFAKNLKNLTLSCAFGNGGRTTPVPVGLLLLVVGLDEDVEGLVPFMLVRGLGADFADGFSGILAARYENCLRLLTVKFTHVSITCVLHRLNLMWPPTRCLGYRIKFI